MNLTTAQLSQATGVPAGTLRVWRSRYGFPAPADLAGGRDRFGEADVRAVQEVRRLRAEGLSMAAAVARSRGTAAPAPTSIYAGLRERRPQLRPQIVQKRALLELTRAIEDEHAARGGDGLLLGSFQEARHYRAGEKRWALLARQVSTAVALADFAQMRTRTGAPIEVPVARDHPLAREWTLITRSAGAQACLAAWEIPSPQPARDGDRQFEFVWSLDPVVVGEAVSIAAALLGRLAPGVAARLVALDDGAMPDQGPGFAADVTARAFAYVSGRLATLAA